MKHVYVCFHRDVDSEVAAKKVQALLPAARIVTLPAEVGDDGGITEFFVNLGRTRVDFEVLLAMAEAGDGDDTDDVPPVPIREFRPYQKKLQRRTEAVKRAVPLHEIAALYTDLRAEGGRLRGHCPFHDERTPTFSVYPKVNVYHCSGCEAQGDVLQFLMNKESMSFRQAVEALERYDFTHELL